MSPARASVDSLSLLPKTLYGLDDLIVSHRLDPVEGAALVMSDGLSSRLIVTAGRREEHDRLTNADPLATGRAALVLGCDALGGSVNLGGGHTLTIARR